MFDEKIPLGDCLQRLLDQLGLDAAHFCARAPQDLVGLVRAAPNRIASATFIGANARPDALSLLGSRVFWITGEGGSIGSTMRPRLESLPSDQVHVLRGYDEFQWSDTVADRTEEVAAAIARFLDRASSSALESVQLSGKGEVAEISYTAAGSGPPVVLLPLGLAARQWDALLPSLRQGYCTIVLGGPRLAPVEMLEARGAGDYSRMALSVLGLAEPRPTDALIEVGCGSGALIRRIVRTFGLERVVGLDVNRFLINEARSLIEKEGLTERIALHEGSGEAIPFPSESFDIVFSSTVMEEVHADRMIAELIRIAKPGGRVAVVVRAVDRGSWTNARVPDRIRQLLESTAGAGGVDEHGCADESLYRRLHEAGLTSVCGGPAWAWTSPGDGWWANVENQIRGRLSPEDADAWSQAIVASQAETFPTWVSRPFHCAVGTKR